MEVATFGFSKVESIRTAALFFTARLYAERGSLHATAIPSVCMPLTRVDCINMV